ncbi:hypothetical protein B0A52_01813 [Exophiala mesophila]|uniref:Fe2OG dioxygenase domain-containing protein n=1 Tax=Exophiala mesophila TaxID=212818 RepID=A0A438NG45_EXOME|nr:hypothetical protein B0A52_01813 [Exophiala mesophila]
MSKRTLEGFFSPALKKPKLDDSPFTTTTTTTTKIPSAVPPSYQNLPTTNHPTYPWPIPHFPPHIRSELETLVTAEGEELRDKPHLDLLYFQPFIPRTIQREVFEFLRSQLFFYRVTYKIKRFGKEVTINTPRFTTVFGVDETSRFVNDEGVAAGLFEASNGLITTTTMTTTTNPPSRIQSNKYKCHPRPIPECLDLLRRVTEACTNTQYNFCLVNYYATGSDSISYHSDDESFLGPDPAIASFSLGAKRDFLMRHKPPAATSKDRSTDDASSDNVKNRANDIKLSLQSGDMILMRGPTQKNWLHSIPKRAGSQSDSGRINITLRRAMVIAGTENYYRYNVGQGPVYRWDSSRREMVLWKST